MYKYVQAIQITSSYGIHMYDNNYCLRLFVFKFHMNNSSFLEI